MGAEVSLTHSCVYFSHSGRAFLVFCSWVCSVISMVRRGHPLFLLKAAVGNEVSEDVQIATEHGGDPVQGPALCVTVGLRVKWAGL